jgi:hypothetical protein
VAAGVDNLRERVGLALGDVAPVIDRKLRDLRNVGSARPGGSCRRFRRRP